MIPDLTPIFVVIAILFIVFVPLGIWKMIDIIIWLCTHVHVG